MGQRHARVVTADPGARLVAAVDLRAERAAAVARATPGCATSLPQSGVDLVIVATPTDTHVQVAAPLLARGLWVLVEKPVARTSAEAEVLQHPRCLVGHCERFNPAVRSGRVQQPRQLTMAREGPWTGRGAEVDVIADLMVHDLDLLLGWSPEVSCVAARGECGPSGKLDRVWAELVGDDLRVQVTADRMAARRHRVVEGTDQTGPVRLDLANGLAERAGRPLPPVDHYDALTAQWQAVRSAVAGTEGPVASWAAAHAVLQLAESIRHRVGEGGGLS